MAEHGAERGVGAMYVAAHPKGWAIREQRYGYSIVVSLHPAQSAALDALTQHNG